MKRIAFIFMLMLLASVMLILSSCGCNRSETTLEISEDGYWVINGEKTDVKAEGKDGEKGDKGDKGDSGAKGEDGEDGKDLVADAQNPLGLAFFLKDDGTYAVEVGQAKYLSEIEIPATYNGKAVTEIGKKGFSDCPNLISVTISEGITKIGDYAFQGSLQTLSNNKIVIPDSVTTIGNYAFQGCDYIDIVWGDGVAIIGDYAFADAIISNGGFIKFPDSLKYIGEGAFSENSFSEIHIPAGVAYIGKNAFSSSFLSKTFYCEAAFCPASWDSAWGPGQYSTVSWGYNNITTDPEYDYVVHNGKATITAYKGSSSEIIIPERLDGYEVTGIGAVFAYNKAITKVVIPEGISYIAPRAFEGCSAITEITLNAISVNDYEIPLMDFLGGSLGIINNQLIYYYGVFSGAGTDGEGVKITIGEKVTYYNERLFFDCNTAEVRFNAVRMNDFNSNASYGNGDIKLVIGNRVEKIPANSFFSVRLKSVEFEEGSVCESIGEFAFALTYITSVTIPDSVISIGAGAFAGCGLLSDFNISENNPAYECIDGVLYTKDGKTLVFCYDNTKTSLTVPDTVNEILGLAFVCSPIKSIVIPGNVTTIGSSAFVECYSLTDVYFGGSEEEWQAALKYDDFIQSLVPALKGVTIHYNYIAE